MIIDEQARRQIDGGKFLRHLASTEACVIAAAEHPAP
jgi:hypothetical protein